MNGKQYVENVVWRHNFWVDDVYVGKENLGLGGWGRPQACPPQVRELEWAQLEGTDDFSKALVLKASGEGSRGSDQFP